MNEPYERIRVAKQRNASENIVTILIQKDGTVLQKDISAKKFPSATGLIRYELDTCNFVVISPVDDVLHPPNGGWGNDLYVVMVPDGTYSNTSWVNTLYILRM